MMTEEEGLKEIEHHLKAACRAFNEHFRYADPRSDSAGYRFVNTLAEVMGKTQRIMQQGQDQGISHDAIRILTVQLLETTRNPAVPLVQ